MPIAMMSIAAAPILAGSFVRMRESVPVSRGAPGHW